MARELNVIKPPGSGGSDACVYMWACAICDENETCQKDKEGHSRWLVAKRMERIEYKVLIMSNKGGVGKSTCTTNLAVSLALKGWHVGICDMDIHGPNIPKMVGAEGQKLKISSSGGIIPFQAYNLKIASMSFLLQNSDDPIIWGCALAATMGAPRGGGRRRPCGDGGEGLERLAAGGFPSAEGRLTLFP